MLVWNFIKATPFFGVIWGIYMLFFKFFTTVSAAEFFRKTIQLSSSTSGQLSVLGNITLQYGDIAIIIGLFVLFVEILKSTSSSSLTITEHVFSLFVLFLFIGSFFTSKYAQNPTFLILGLMSVIDVAAGFSITITAARRDFTVS